MRVLIIDDDTIVLESCRRILESENIEVMSSSTADEALRILEDEDFDLLIVDIIMPEKNGYYVMDRVRERWPDTRAVVMSGYPTPEVIERVRSAGAAGFISKPFGPDELLLSFA